MTISMESNDGLAERERDQERGRVPLPRHETRSGSPRLHHSPDDPTSLPTVVALDGGAPEFEQLPCPNGATGRAWQTRHTELSVSIVIPTWNEAANIGPVLRRLGRFDDIILVDAFSEDGTVERALDERPDLRVVSRSPQGKGDALRAGFAEATGDVIVIMDADGSMDPAEIDVFLSMIAVGFDLVKGSRMACGGGSHDLTRVRELGNAALCGLANRLFRTQWTDLCYGFLAFRRSCLPQLMLRADGFEIESQILAHAALAGLRIAEVPSVELTRLAGESHLAAGRDGRRILRAMLSARFAPRSRRAAAALRPPVAG